MGWGGAQLTAAETMNLKLRQRDEDGDWTSAVPRDPSIEDTADGGQWNMQRTSHRTEPTTTLGGVT